MKKIRFITLICVLMLLCGCAVKPANQYQRIDLGSEEQEETLAHIGEGTTVEYGAKESFSKTLPVYEISAKRISKFEIQVMSKSLEKLNSGSGKLKFYTNGNSISASRERDQSGELKAFDATDEEIEKMAWEALKKVPFLKGKYEYLGIASVSSQGSSLEGMTKYQVSASFATLLDGVRVVGGEMINFSFDADGLCGVALYLYDYKKVGTMDLVPLEDASARIKQPDAFVINTKDGSIAIGMVEKLEVERVKLLLVNQYSRGCTILQPVYNFIGTATDADGVQAEFSSRVIAIPESYTYEKPED